MSQNDAGDDWERSQEDADAQAFVAGEKQGSDTSATKVD